MYLRPQSSVDIPEPSDETGPRSDIPVELPAELPAVVALLDGFPVQNHQLLRNRIEVDDADDMEPLSVVSERYHGTAMASLILHGDRNRQEPSIQRRLHVRPVLYAPGNGVREEPRRDRLLVDDNADLPNISSALGLGHRKVIKPDIHLPGGREHIRFQGGGQTLIVVPGGRSGLSTASPDPDGSLDSLGLTPGTSAATALATRAAHRIFEALMDRSGGSLLTKVDPQFYAVVVKALLVHRSGWGNRAQVLDRLYGPHGQGQHVARRDNIARLLGYGFPDVEEAISCAPNRATLVGYGTIRAREANIHRIPLPPSLEMVTEPRAITVTVAWLSPINRFHQAYRRAKLEVTDINRLPTAAGVTRASLQPSYHSVLRGTLFHTRYEGEDAVPFIDGGYVRLRVVCKEQAGSLDQSINYGVAVTIEAGEGIPVYQEVRDRLAVPVRPRVS